MSDRPDTSRSAYWLGVGALAAGLGAAVVSGQGVAHATGDDGGARDAGSTSASAETRGWSKPATRSRSSADTGDRGTRPEREGRARPERKQKSTDGADAGERQVKRHQRDRSDDSADEGAAGQDAVKRETATAAERDSAPESAQAAEKAAAAEKPETTENASETTGSGAAPEVSSPSVPAPAAEVAESPKVEVKQATAAVSSRAASTKDTRVAESAVKAKAVAAVATAAAPKAASATPVAAGATALSATAGAATAKVATPSTATVTTTVAVAPGADTLVAGKVTWSTIVVDMLTWLGWRPAGLQVTQTSAAVPAAVATWWMKVRTEKYGPAPAQPTPTEPVDPPVTPTPVDPTPVDPTPANPTPTDPTSSLPAAGALVWESNFSNITELQRYWSTQTGRWGASSGENQYYTADLQNVSVSAEGYLVIELRQEQTPDNAAAGDDYTSARLVTYGKATVVAGERIVARIQLPFTKGTLPAFWMVGLEPGHEFDWPRQGEVDIVELPGTGDPADASVWTGNIHGPSATDNTVDVKLDNVDADLGEDLSAGFHEYGIDWYSDRIVWHVDGQVTGEITQAEYEAMGGNWTAFSGAWSHYLILNVALGNNWTGDADATSTLPQQMLVDWVRVYTLV